MIDVLVTGAAGKMGSMCVATIAEQNDLRTVALVDPQAPADAQGAPWFADLEGALAATRPHVALDFSVPGAVFANTMDLLKAGVPTVVGATGLSDENVDSLAACASEMGVGLAIIPNFALGAVLMMRFAAEAARYYEQAEIIEFHGAKKIDAPSGTSLRTASLMAEVPGSSLREAPSADLAARGQLANGICVHSVRLPGLVAHQEVLFGGEDELLTIRHDSLSRRSFMPGVLLALRGTVNLKKTVLGLENLLDMQ